MVRYAESDTARCNTLAPAADGSFPGNYPEKDAEAMPSRLAPSMYGGVLHARLIVPRHPAVPHLQTTRSTSLSNR